MNGSEKIVDIASTAHRPQLYLIVALAYLATVWTKEYAFDFVVEKFKYPDIDEIAQLLRQKGVLDLVEETIPTVRGHGVSVITSRNKYLIDMRANNRGAR